MVGSMLGPRPTSSANGIGIVVVGDDDRARMTMHVGPGRMRVEYPRSGRAREVVGGPPACSTMPQFERRRRIRSAMTTTDATEAIESEMYGGERWVCSC